MNTRQRTGVVLLALFLIAGVTIRLLISREFTAQGLRFDWPEFNILQLRFGAVESALLAGGCLGLSGLLLQALLRNPLAAPFILGLSAGAGLGATLAMYSAITFNAGVLGWIATALGVADGIVAGTIGSLAVLTIVYALGRRGGRIDPLTLVLAGTVVSSICGALTLLVQSMMPPASRGDSWTWFMGQIPEVPARGPAIAAALLLVIMGLLAWRRGRALDVASTSDDEAESLGVSLKRLRLVLFVGAGALASASVALCGPLAFVGFVAPHLSRLCLGSQHRALVPASVIAGAALLVWADAIRQAIDLGAGRLPIGVLTALIGGPVFLCILRSRRLVPGVWPC
ncbi:MAG: iron ABC transporter permease [Phycisphaerales bacterium]|nr:iron ABC transporter permease [Phycisphaerales bacterium]